jgi:hypothetical protein
LFAAKALPSGEIHQLSYEHNELNPENIFCTYAPRVRSGNQFYQVLTVRKQLGSLHECFGGHKAKANLALQGQGISMTTAGVSHPFIDEVSGIHLGLKGKVVPEEEEEHLSVASTFNEKSNNKYPSKTKVYKLPIPPGKGGDWKYTNSLFNDGCTGTQLKTIAQQVDTKFSFEKSGDTVEVTGQFAYMFLRLVVEEPPRFVGQSADDDDCLADFMDGMTI